MEHLYRCYVKSPEPQFKYNLKHGRVGRGGKCAYRHCCLLCLKEVCICFSRLTQVWSKPTAVRPWAPWQAAGDGPPGMPSSRSWAEKPEPNLAVCVFLWQTLRFCLFPWIIGCELTLFSERRGSLGLRREMAAFRLFFVGSV